MASYKCHWVGHVSFKRKESYSTACSDGLWAFTIAEELIHFVKHVAYLCLLIHRFIWRYLQHVRGREEFLHERLVENRLGVCGPWKSPTESPAGTMSYTPSCGLQNTHPTFVPELRGKSRGNKDIVSS